MRDNHGRFVKGGSGGPGRPKRATEQEYLATLSEAVSLTDWREVVTRAVSDAKSGDAKAREWLTKYLIGEAKGGDGADTEPNAEADNARERLELVGEYLLPLKLAEDGHPVEEHARMAANQIMAQQLKDERERMREGRSTAVGR